MADCYNGLHMTKEEFDNIGREFEALFKKYKANMEGLTEEQRNGKYKASLDALKERLKKAGTTYLYSRVLREIYLPVTEQGQTALRDICHQLKADEAEKKFMETIFTDMDLNKANQIVADESYLLFDQIVYPLIYNTWEKIVPMFGSLRLEIPGSQAVENKKKKGE